MKELRKNTALPPYQISPAVALINPRSDINVGNVLRACSCFGAQQLWWTGNRVSLDIRKGYRLPREERMKGYRDVESFHSDDRLFDYFPAEVTPVAVELTTNSENLFLFEHPEHALYVFGPEDGSLPKWVRLNCHRFLMIPSKHCLNLAAAVNVVLAFRSYQRTMSGNEPLRPLEEYLAEHRGPVVDGEDLLVGISDAGRGRFGSARR